MARNPLVVSMIHALQQADAQGRYVPNYLRSHNPQSVLAVPADPSHRRDLIQGALQQVTRDSWFLHGPNPHCYLPKPAGQHWAAYYGPGVAAAWKGVHSGLHDKSFGDILLEGVIAVTDNPAFKAIIGIATAAIPGVGAVLAPLAVALETAVTNLVKKAHEGHIDAGDVLSNVANVAMSSTGALSAASPALKDAIDTGRTTFDKVKATASQVTAIARAATQVDLVHELTMARSLLLRAKHGDKAAHAQLAHISRCARAGQPAAIKVLALTTAVAHGMKHGHIPHATPIEIACFRSGKPLPRHLAYFSAPHLRHPFLFPKGRHTIGTHPLAHLSIHEQAAHQDRYSEDENGATDGTMHYGDSSPPAAYNESNGGYDNEESGSYALHDGEADDPDASEGGGVEAESGWYEPDPREADYPDASEGGGVTTCECDGAAGVGNGTQPFRFAPGFKLPPKRTPFKFAPGFKLPPKRTPFKFAPGFKLPAHAATPFHFAPGFAVPAAAASSLPFLPAGGGYGGGDGGGGSDSAYGYAEPGASAANEGDQPGTYGDDPDQDERSEAASEDQRDSDTADWAAE